MRHNPTPTPLRGVLVPVSGQKYPSHSSMEPGGKGQKKTALHKAAESAMHAARFCDMEAARKYLDKAEPLFEEYIKKYPLTNDNIVRLMRDVRQQVAGNSVYPPYTIPMSIYKKIPKEFREQDEHPEPPRQAQGMLNAMYEAIVDRNFGYLSPGMVGSPAEISALWELLEDAAGVKYLEERRKFYEQERKGKRR